MVLNKKRECYAPHHEAYSDISLRVCSETCISGLKSLMYLIVVIILKSYHMVVCLHIMRNINCTESGYPDQAPV